MMMKFGLIWIWNESRKDREEERRFIKKSIKCTQKEEERERMNGKKNK